MNDLQTMDAIHEKFAKMQELAIFLELKPDEVEGIGHTIGSLFHYGELDYLVLSKDEINKTWFQCKEYGDEHESGNYFIYPVD